MEIFTKERLRHFATASAVTALLAAAAPAASASSLPVNVPTPPPLVWQQCALNPARECARLRVPLNYANPAEGFIELPVARRRADGASFGPLVMNFGGPVSQGAFLLEVAGDENFTHEMLELYDMVAVDARGMTNGITCFDSQTQGEYWRTNHFSRSTAELNHLLALERAANERCLQDDPATARNMSSAASIRDMESLRLALGVNQISFFGISYGTYFGNRYAALYPGRVRAMVLDAVVDHGISDPEIVNDLVKGYEESWTAFKQWCADTANPCRLRGQNLDALFDELHARARSPGIPAPGNVLDPDRPVNDWELNFALLFSVISGVQFDLTETILFEASQNDASLAGAIYDESTGLQPDGSYATGGTFRAITCVDSRWSQLLPNASAARAFTLVAKAISPHFGENGFVQSPQQCFGYPVAPTEAPPVNTRVAPGIPPVLVIGATLDRFTPLKWSQSVAARIPDSRLIVRNGNGHGSLGRSECVRQIVADYLGRGIAPASGIQCPTDPRSFSPARSSIPDPSQPQGLIAPDSNLLQGTPRRLPET